MRTTSKSKPPKVQTGRDPMVTVIAVCYNHERFVVDCLESIWHQTYRHKQVLVVDDCSSDMSVSLIRSWLRKRDLDWAFIAHDRNCGLCKTLNECLALATGEYISIIATDDLWLPNKLNDQVSIMESLSERVGVVYSDALQIDEAGCVLPRTFIEEQRGFSSLPEGDVFRTLADGNFIPAMATLVRRSCYDRVGHYDEQLCYEDWDMWLRIAVEFEFAASASISAKYRIVQNSMTRTILQSQDPRFVQANRMILSKCLRSKRLDSTQEKAFREAVSYYERIEAAAARLFGIISGRSFILLDEQSLPLDRIHRSARIPFLERDGQYYGLPPDDATAIHELGRARKAGVEYLVFVWPSYWWFDYYRGFYQYLMTSFKRVVQDDELVVVRLVVSSENSP
jgi:glycosyltransferase involved in cell wall biosynthesis